MDTEAKEATPPKRTKTNGSNSAAPSLQERGQGDSAHSSATEIYGSSSNGVSNIDPKNNTDPARTELIFSQIERLRFIFPGAQLDNWFDRLEKAEDVMSEAAAIEIEFKERSSNYRDGAMATDPDPNWDEEDAGEGRHSAALAREQVSSF